MLFYVFYHSIMTDVLIYILSQLILHANPIVRDLHPRRALFHLLCRFEIDFTRSCSGQSGRDWKKRGVLVVEIIRLYFFDTCRNNSRVSCCKRLETLSLQFVIFQELWQIARGYECFAITYILYWKLYIERSSQLYYNGNANAWRMFPTRLEH